MEFIRKCLWIVCVWIISIGVSAQTITLKGKVLDATSGEPIPFANIYITPDHTKSTITNLNGEFSLNDLNDQDSIRISYVGYEVLKVKCPAHWEKDITFQLKSRAYELQEVIISNVTIESLLKEVQKNRKKNYPDKYPILRGIYRKQEVSDNELVALYECNLDLKIPSVKMVEKGKKPQISVSNLKILNPLETSGKRLFGIFLYIEPMAYPTYMELSPENYNNYSWMIEQITLNDDGDDIYKISYKGTNHNNKNDKGYVYISKKEQAVVALHIVREIQNIQNKNEDIEIRSSYCFWDVFYKKVEGRYQYSYMRTECLTKYYDWEKDQDAEYRIAVDYLVDGNIEQEKECGKFESYNFDPFKRTDGAFIKPINDFRKILPDYE